MYVKVLVSCGFRRPGPGLRFVWRMLFVPFLCPASRRNVGFPVSLVDPRVLRRAPRICVVLPRKCGLVRPLVPVLVLGWRR